MQLKDYRILAEYGIQPAQWAILLAASHLVLLPLKDFMFELKLEQAENFSEDELWDALAACKRHKWIVHDDQGVALTKEGRRLQEDVSAVLQTNIYVLADVAM